MRSRLGSHLVHGKPGQVAARTGRQECLPYFGPMRALALRGASRLLDGRLGPGSKIHHKFAILDAQSVIAGSYNWTVESEQEIYENLIILRDPAQVKQYQEEFGALWREATKHD